MLGSILQCAPKIVCSVQPCTKNCSLLVTLPTWEIFSPGSDATLSLPASGRAGWPFFVLFSTLSSAGASLARSDEFSPESLQLFIANEDLCTCIFVQGGG